MHRYCLAKIFNNYSLAVISRSGSPVPSIDLPISTAFLGTPCRHHGSLSLSYQISIGDRIGSETIHEKSNAHRQKPLIQFGQVACFHPCFLRNSFIVSCHSEFTGTLISSPHTAHGHVIKEFSNCWIFPSFILRFSSKCLILSFTGFNLSIMISWTARP